MEAYAAVFRAVRWDGFHLYDLIFPLFLFIAGVAAPYSISSRLRKGSSRQDVLRHIVRRGLILVLLGIIYNNGLKVQPISEIRFGSVLGRSEERRVGKECRCGGVRKEGREKARE